ncbi:aquaporin [Fusarium heterosporum]|uniref:Aquaporin n=1 Tax=Fusarium heterosporum TaxID=42747 RepID=A0A8H5WZ30_FUSHE|nr:aquaporin [Fusarium heterosporum]
MAGSAYNPPSELGIASPSSQDKNSSIRENSPEMDNLPSNSSTTPVITHGDNIPNRNSETDTVVPLQPVISQDATSFRPGSRTGNFPTPRATRFSQDGGEPVHYSGSVKSNRRRPRERDEYDFDQAADYPTQSDYERYWRTESRNDRDRYAGRRGPYPPPTFMNRRRIPPHDSDDEFYSSDDPRMPPSGGRRMMDEEMGAYAYPSRPFNPRRTSTLNGFNITTGKLEWNNLSSKEKSEIMRLPLTQWMNSNFKNHFVASLGELIGTTMFLFFAFAGTEVANIQAETNNRTTTGESTGGLNVSKLLYISIIFGFSLMVNVWVFFRISGGLFNPAVTIAMLMVKAISMTRAICLFLAQILGSMLASVVVRYLFPETFNVRTTLGGGASLVQGVFIEALLTAELVFTIFMLAKEKHKATFIAPVGIGLALFIAEMVGVQFTGGSLNPARSFGPCVITGTFDSEHWIYWVGPGIGSLIAVCFYWFIKTLEYEMANPGADGDDLNDPTKNPEKRAEVQASSKVPTAAFGVGKTPSILS